MRHRYFVLVNAVFFVLMFAPPGFAQQPGPNVDVLPAYPNGNPSPPFPPPPISLTDATRGDGYLQRQVEPVVATSTYNPDHILAAFGDYRTTQIPNDTGLPGTSASGWIGLSRSYDRGHTWFGSMVPCFPRDTSSICSSSPLSGLQAGSDPSLATTPNGHFYLGALFFTPSHISNVAVVHYRDVPDTDGGDTIRYQGVVTVDKGSQADSGNFIDKPGIAADIARGTTSASVCGPVYIAYTIFTGGGGSTPFTSKLGFTRSKQGKCGTGWDNPQYLNKNYKQNQGAAVAVDPNTGKIYVVWRHVFQAGGDGFPDSILMATSTDGGGSFSSPVPITPANFAPFDQPSLTASSYPNNPAFRSNSFPTITVDGNGNVYVADQEKVYFTSGYPSGYYEPRIVIRTLSSGSSTWTTGSIVDPGTGSAQQFMPVLSFAGGLLKLMWYDFRNQNQVSDNVAGGWFVTGLDRQVRTYVAQSSVSSNGNLALDGNGNPAFSLSVPVTQYLVEVNTGQIPTVGNSLVSFNAQGTEVNGGYPAVNRPNLPMYAGGTTPFTGDYTGLTTASPFVANPGGTTAFRWATKPSDYIATPSFGVWTDARDVVFPTADSGGIPNLYDLNGWTQYAPPGTGSASTCLNAGSRNANVYLSEIKPGVIAGSPATSRQLVDGTGAPMERAFPIYIQNPNPDAPNQTPPGLFFRVTFQSLGSTPVLGSFVQGTETTGATTSLDLNILQFSTSTITLYVFCPGCSSSVPLAPFSATVQQINTLGGSVVSGGLTTTIFFDSDPTAPSVTNSQLGTQEIHNITLSNPQFTNPQFTNPQFTNPQFTNPQYTNPQFTNPQFTNVAPVNTLPVGDFVWQTTSAANNASAYTALANIAASNLSNQYIYEAIISRTYNFPGFNSCQSQPIPQDAIISIIPNPQFTNPQFTNPQFTNPQFTNPQFTNATFATVPPPEGSTATAASTTTSTSTSTSTDDGTTKMPLGTDHVYFVLRVYRASGGTTPLTTTEQSQIIANTSLLVFPQAPNTGTGTPTQLAAAQATSNKVFTSTALSSSTNSSVFGQTVTFTATISPLSSATCADGSTSCSPTGSVDFKDGSTLLQTVPVSGGMAVLQISTLSAGSHTITAAYSGDVNFVGSISNSVTQGVSQAPSSLQLTSSANPSVVGQPVTFTATVTGAGSLNGNVQFTIDNGHTLTQQVSLTNGVAMLGPISTLSAGSHTVAAQYNGDNNHLGSSGSLVQTVNNLNITSFSSNTVTTNGNASTSSGVLNLTPELTDQAGSGWFNYLQPVKNGFSTTFTYNISNPQNLGSGSYPADGIAFVIQNATAGLTTLGGDGGDIGYGPCNTLSSPPCTGPIDNSLVIEFDTFQNPDFGDPNSNHIAVQSCGIVNGVGQPNSPVHSGSCNLAIYSPAESITGQHTVTVTYDATGGTLTVVLDSNTNSPITAISISSFNLASYLNFAGANTDSAYLGFTSGTGALEEQGDILSWTFTPSP